MKILAAILLVLLPFSALAQTAPIKPLHPANVEIIDGKKFFSLANVRRMENASPSPQALAVINNPRTADLRVTPASRLGMTPVASSATTPKIDNTLPWAKPDTPTMPSAASLGLTGAAAQKADLLSIFAPDDHALPTMGALKTGAIK